MWLMLSSLLLVYSAHVDPETPEMNDLIVDGSYCTVPYTSAPLPLPALLSEYTVINSSRICIYCRL
jgi:hypothetical protein